uniref:Heat shock protein, alpha-crystallin-related, b11 n=1 Tax=Nothobranchius furzeri TaxID=105023 RepID=A0A8C6VU39_NOTFU
MSDSSFNSLGVKVVFASSCDENHPPENIMDGNTKTFWTSTGMFPQEFVIRFPEPTRVAAVTVESYNGTKTVVTINSTHCPGSVMKFERTERHLQLNTLSLNGSSAVHLRFVIASGHDHFVSVHRVTVKT